MKSTEPQRHCIQESFGHPVALVAGAGSGKTATLTNRIIYALEHPEVSGVDDIDQVLAITFTRKAAEELRSRIKGALQSAGARQPRLAEQALKAEGAWISTIHGMCARMIRENAFTLGIDPAFTVLAEVDQKALLDAALERVLQDGGVDVLVAEYGRAQVKAHLVALAAIAAEATAPPSELFHCPPQPTSTYGLSELVRYYQQVATDPTVQSDGGQKVGDWLVATREALEHVLAAVDCETEDAFAPLMPGQAEALDALDALEQFKLVCVLPKIPKSPKAMLNVDLMGTGSTSQEVIYPRIYALQMAAAADFAHELVGLLQPTLRHYEQAKQVRGALDNGDLMRHAHRLLTDPAFAQAGQAYASRFKLVMVDEFQDTNQMQVDMVNLLAGGAPGEPSSRLCVVGDAQQSIYAFRGADLAVFKDYVAQVEASDAGEVIRMGHNFRSNPEILAFSKGAFANTFGIGPGGLFLELLPGRNEDARHEDGTPVHAFHGGQGSGAADANAAQPQRINVKAMDMSRGQATEVAAESIAADFAQLIEAGHQPGQMAILLSAMRNAPVYAQALRRHNIPCAITGGSVFATAAEPGLVVALCQALVDMRDTDALIRVLASDLFALEAEDFVNLLPTLPLKRDVGASGLADRFAEQLAFLEGKAPELVDPDASVRLNNAVAVLCKAAARVGIDPLSEIVSDVLAESGWLARMQGTGMPQAANAFKAVRLLQQLEAEGLDAASLVQAVQASLEANKETPGVLNTAGGNLVQIMTIHASKGLQFPIVAVAEAAVPTHRVRSFYLVQSGTQHYLSLNLGATLKDAGPVYKDAQKLSRDLLGIEGSPDDLRKGLSSTDPALYQVAVAGLHDVAADEEHQRKLYVAYTRAEEALIAVVETPEREGATGQVTSGGEIVRTLCGADGLPASDVDATYACQLCPVRTAFDDPERGTLSLDWTARLEVFREAEEDQTEQAVPTVPTYGSLLPFMVPTQLRIDAVPSGRYRLMWSQGVLSASSMKHEKAEAEQASASQPATFADPQEAERSLMFEGTATQGDLESGRLDMPTPDDPAERPAPATDKGTAFHAMGELAANAWTPGQKLAMPAAERLRAIARLYGLNTQQEAATIAQLESWIACPVAERMAAQDYLVAEAPFWVQLADATDAADAAYAAGHEVAPGSAHARGPLVLQGFIDLLAYNTFGQGQALVVDYKTGTALTAEAQRRAAYEIQAKVYAYALLCQGFDTVKLQFVFVEQPDAQGNPQVVEFPPTGEADYTIDTLCRELVALVESTGD